MFGPDPDNQWHIQFDGSAANSEIILYFDITKENTTPSTFKQSVMSGEDCEIDQSSENQLDIKVFTNITPGTSNSLMNFVETRFDIKTAKTAYPRLCNTLDSNAKMVVISFCIRNGFGLVEYLDSDRVRADQFESGTIRECWTLTHLSNDMYHIIYGGLYLQVSPDGEMSFGSR